jgi:hypothetical protein
VPQDAPHAWIADDGELADVREILTRLGLVVAEGAPGEGARAALLVTTPGRCLAAERAGGGLPVAQVHVVVTEALSRRGAEVLARARCDFVLQRPFEPALLELLAQRALYQGTERRSGPRVALGARVAIRSGRREHPAVLAQLSRRGCGIHTALAVEKGQALALKLGREVTGSQPLVLEGKVLSVREARGAGEREVSLGFAPLSPQAQEALRELFRKPKLPLPPRPSAAPAARAPAPGKRGAEAAQRAAESEPSGGERRRARRARFRGAVQGVGPGVVRPLIGRDLSPGGMRVVRDPELALGDRLALALRPGRGSERVLVKATVDRDDGPGGWFLRFQEVTADLAARLERLVQELPAVSAAAAEREAESGPQPGVVLTEVLERGRG